jgi:hypothetical protein
VKLNDWNPIDIKKDALLVKSLYPLITSHSPDCTTFEGEFFSIGRVKLCVGCFLSYPLAILFVVLYLVFGNVLGIPFYFYILFGAVFGLFQLLNLLNISNLRVSKIIVKLCLGIGLGMITIGIFTIPIHLIFRILIFIVGMSMARSIAGFRLYRIEKICKKCPQYDNWYYCDGFKVVTCKLEKNGFRIK